MRRLAFAVVLLSPVSCSQEPFDKARERMVREQLESRDVRHKDVLRAMRATPRHLFIPEEFRDAAYEDFPVRIGYEQTISQPYIVGLMTQLLDPRPEHKVLEIGAGSGYQAAVLSQLVKEVYTMEIVPQLAERSAKTLARLGYRNVTVRLGDGYKGWPEKAPFDRIIVTAAPPKLPQALLDQLAPGGRLVAPVGEGFDQWLWTWTKDKAGRVSRRQEIPVRFVPIVPGR